MAGILVSLEGTICDARHRRALRGRPEYYAPEQVAADEAVPGSVAFVQDLEGCYERVYVAARPEHARCMA